MEESNVKKRKSKFDQPPPSFDMAKYIAEMQAQSLLPPTAVQPANAMLAATLASMEVPKSATLASMEVPAFSFPETLVAAPPIAKDPTYTKRLSAALNRTFDYLNRIDSGMIEALLGDGSVNSNVVIPPKKQESFGHKMYNKNKKSVVRVAGIGAQNTGSTGNSSNNANQPTSCNSVYVSGLPPDFTEQDIGALFAVHGKIKKIKCYMDKQTGKKKGDALVSYQTAEVVPVVCRQFNQMQIGEGVTISVTPAAFAGAATTAPTISSSSVTSVASSVTYRTVCSANLPSQTKPASFPSLVFCHIFDSSLLTQQPDLVQELQADLLEACCLYGDIEHVMTLPYIKDALATDDDACRESLKLADASQGMVIITFRTLQDCKKCIKELAGRMFDGSPLDVCLCTPPSHPSYSEAECKGVSVNDDNRHSAVGTTNDDPGPAAAAVVEDDVDVDSFLNSLL